MENGKTIISFETFEGKKFISELHWDANINDVLDAFVGMMVSATFPYETVLSEMHDFSEEALEAHFPNNPIISE